MSIVSVHGPHTFGSKAVAKGQSTYATVTPANGLIWTFALDAPSPRPDQDFSWAFPPDGTPTPQTVEAPSAVTYAAAGSKTATLTVTNVSRTVSNKALTNNVATLTTTATSGFAVGQVVTVSGVGAPFDGTFVIASTPSGTTFTYPCVAANVTSAASGGTVASAASQTPAAGTYNITVTAVAGAAPREVLMGEQQSAPDEEPPPEEPPPAAEYDPADYTVAEVVTYAETLTTAEEVGDLIDSERLGKNRVTLINQLETIASNL